jgi:endonuclease YncB( thermonuclease family)
MHERGGFRGFDEQLRFEPGRKRPGRSRGPRLALFIAAAVLAGAGLAFGSLDLTGAGARADPSRGVRAHFSLCFIGGGYNCVVDGDTIWLGGEKIRIADIDAPETHDPRCACEKQLGDRATLRLQQLLNRGSVTLRPIDRDRDRYGRKLRLVLVNGMSVGDTLVAEGLARRYAGHRRPWC